MNKRNKTERNSSKEEINGFYLSPKLWILAILILTTFVYLPSLNNDFTNWDDQKYVLENTLLEDVSFDGIMNIVSTPIGANHHPLTMLSLALNYQISEFDPFSYHLVNLILHLINTLLVFVFIYHLSQKKIEVAVIVSVFFGIHPMHVESVAWIAERKDVLYTCFFLLSLISYLKFLDFGKRVYYWGALAFFILSILSKPAAVVLPVVLVLIDYFRGKNIVEWKGLINKVPFFLISILMGIVTLNIQREFGAISEEITYSIWEKIMFASNNVFVYVLKSGFPIGLSPIYPFPSISNGLSINYQIAPFGLVTLMGLITYYFRKNRVIMFGLLFFLVNIALVLQVISVGNSIISERYTYVPYIGLFFILGEGYYYLRRSENSWSRLLNIFVNVILVAVTLVFSISGYRQVKVWENSETLWTKAISVFPESYTAWYNRGLFYDEKGKTDKAIYDYSNAINNKPGYVIALVNRGRIYQKSQEFDKALLDFNSAINSDSLMIKAYIGRGNTYLDLQNLDMAIDDYSQVIEMDSNNYFGFQGRGNAYSLKAEYRTAIEDFQRVIVINPQHMDAHYNIGICYAKLDEKKIALEYILKAQDLGKPIPSELMNWLKM